MRSSLFLVFALGAPSCVPSYQASAYNGGYEDYRAGADSVFVAYHGNGYIGEPEVVRYWHMRAAEVCGGEDKYEIISMAAKGETYELGDRKRKYTEMTTKHEETTSREATVTEEKPQTVTKYDASGHVRCVNGGTYDPKRKLWKAE